MEETGMNTLAVQIIILALCMTAVRAEEFESLRAKSAKAKYELALRKAKTAYVHDLKESLSSAMRARDLDEATRVQAEIRKIEHELALLGGDATQKRITVRADQGPANPHGTGIRLQRGQSFALTPDPRDTWSGGGSKNGVFCDYMGYPDRGNRWMRLMCQVGNGQPIPVVSGAKVEASADGELFLFANDDRAAGNQGKVTVSIKYRK